MQSDMPVAARVLPALLWMRASLWRASLWMLDSSGRVKPEINREMLHLWDVLVVGGREE